MLKNWPAPLTGDTFPKDPAILIGELQIPRPASDLLSSTWRQEHPKLMGFLAFFMFKAPKIRHGELKQNATQRPQNPDPNTLNPAFFHSHSCAVSAVSPRPSHLAVSGPHLRALKDLTTSGDKGVSKSLKRGTFGVYKA